MLLGKPVNQFFEHAFRVTDYRHPVTDEDCVEIEREKMPNAMPQTRRIVQHALAQEAEAPGRFPNDRVAHYQSSSLGPQECHLAGTLTADAYHLEPAYLFAGVKFTVKHGALGFRVSGVFAMHVGTAASPLANPIRAAHVISIRQQNSAYTPPDKFAQHIVVRLDRVYTEISASIGNQQAVEIVAMRLGKPRPS